jgi:hypothetical protein
MGNFYTNITLRGPSQEEVAAALEDRGYRAFIAPTINGLTAIYEQDCDDQNLEELRELANYSSLDGRFRLHIPHQGRRAPRAGD